MQTIGILHHPRIPASLPMADTISEWLQTKGIHSWIGSNADEAEISDQLDQLSLLVVLGGDGSILRAARLSVSREIPLFGINMGRVGFLSEAQLDNWQERLSQVLEDKYWIENRLMLHATLERNGRSIQTYVALNDLVVGRGKQARVVRFQLRVDGDFVAKYTTDALIVATPTGSTAYAMAAGGPLLPPQLQNFVILPVAAHLSFDRALVLHETAVISIDVEMDHEAYITPDGQHGNLVQNGDKIIIRKNKQMAPFARIDSSGYFYRRLMGRLGYFDR